MPTSRRDFLKTTAITGTSLALGGLPALAATAEESSLMPGGSSAAAPLEQTRGVGIYPGLPSQFFGPSLKVDKTTYRNIALLRPAYHSSSYDYNLTAQLVTDGIKDTRLPDWIAVADSTHGALPIEQREVIVDHFPMEFLELKGGAPTVQLQIGGGESVPAVDRIELMVIAPPQVPRSALRFNAFASDDGHKWTRVGGTSAPPPASLAGYPPSMASANQFFTPSLPLDKVCNNRFYKIELKAELEGSGVQADWLQWRLAQVAFYQGKQRVQIGGPYKFTSAWKSAGLGEEWVYIDLGPDAIFDRVALHWIARAAEGELQVSDDAENWRTIRPLAGGSGNVEDIPLGSEVKARYLRVLMTRPTSPDGYLLSEVEVFGRGGLVAQPQPALTPKADGALALSGGSWKLQRSSLVKDQGEALATIGYQDAFWVPATVPGTILTSYFNVGALPDPNYGKNQLYISDSFFYSDFWYRTGFVAPAVTKKQVAWLNLDGVNWKAEVYLNGKKLGRVEGGFQRGRFDVTDKLLPGQKNALAILVEKNATPGSIHQKTFENVGKNGGALGLDNPTYHASAGWDWIPTIRGRNTGIWGDVSVSVTGAVTLEDPYVTTKLPLPKTDSADVSLHVTVRNHRATPVRGVLHLRFGDLQLTQPLSLEGSATKAVVLSPETHKQLHLANPKLWQPAGYGEPNLYDVELTLEAAGEILDAKRFKAGLRQMTYSEEGGILKLWINGRRIIARGGNWGFSESMLRYRAREYDAAARYHREMNFNLVRNWVGQIGDEAFYEACDRHGILIWQDFWLANPWDGPEPADQELFLANARDLVSRIRKHPSIALYCGRNEGMPPKPLQEGLQKLVEELHPGMHYIGDSAHKVVSGEGPYQVMPTSFYFRAADVKLHSEIGLPAIPPLESLREMMPEKELWPLGLTWGLHDFSKIGAQGGESFLRTLEASYGGAGTLEEWVTYAQWMCYEGYRAVFESQSRHRMGVLLWMSHPCWPSFVWQTYDYYFEPTAAYFGSKKGSEPLHIQWNRLTDTIEVVNYSAGNQKGLTAKVEIFNLDGKPVTEKSAPVDIAEDSTVSAIPMEYPQGLSPVHFLRLTLGRDSEILSTNFYVRPLEEANYRALRLLPKPQIQAETTAEQKGDRWLLTTQLKNAGNFPALMIRIKAIREKSGERILPAIYSDNYIALLPGESRSLTTEIAIADARGEKPSVVVAK